MKHEFVGLLVMLAFAIGCVCGFFARSGMAPTTPVASSASPPSSSGYPASYGSNEFNEPATAPAVRITSPNRATARGYAIEFIHRALKQQRDSTDIAFQNMHLKPDGENAWLVDGSYRPDAGVYDFSLRVWAVLHEGQWIWSCKDLVIGGKKFPDEINFQDHTK